MPPILIFCDKMIDMYPAEDSILLKTHHFS